MLKNIIKIAYFSLILLTMDGLFSLAMAPFPPGPTTPTSLVMTVNSVALVEGLANPRFRMLFNIPFSLDVITQTVQADPDNEFGNGIAPSGDYTGIRLALSATGSYTGTDPCTGEPVANADVQLPDSSNGVVVIYLQEPHPVLGPPPGSIPTRPFTVGGAKIELRLVFPASNSVVCASSAEPLRLVSGDTTGLGDPAGIYLDTEHNEIIVTNPKAQSVTIYNRNDNGNVLPKYAIVGNATGLKGPIGVSVDRVNDEIIVANGDGHSVTIYSRDDVISMNSSGDLNVVPRRTISGLTTGLNGPGGVSVDTINNEIIVANGGNDSLTIYNRDDDGNIAPIRTIVGPNTGLGIPCGVSVDRVSSEIVVANNGDDSVTIYSRDAEGDIAPIRTIRGSNTDLSRPCGLYVDTDNNEIGVANNGNDTVTIYSRTSSGNVHPLRTIRGNNTGLNRPVGIDVDTNDNEIVVTNNAIAPLNDSLRVYKRDDDTVELAQLPVIINSAFPQVLIPQYSFSGSIDGDTGTRARDPATGDLLPIQFNGYKFIWTITNNLLRSDADAIDARLIPPVDVVFTLTDQNPASNFVLDCPSFTPFIRLVLTTNCPPSPLILSPFPTPTGEYIVTAILLGELINSKIPIISNPLPTSEFPRVVPTITVAVNNAIEKIDWIYVNEADVELTLPMIFSQQFSISLSRTFDEVSDCYVLVAGRSPNLVFSSGAQAPAVRSHSEIKNNRCDIFLDDVAAISFSTTDALTNSYTFRWTLL